jgi:hypothetical protein
VLTALSQIFTLIEFFMQALKIWDDFLTWTVEKHKQEIDERLQRLSAAVDASTKANTDDEIWKSQDEIVKNLPGTP